MSKDRGRGGEKAGKAALILIDLKPVNTTQENRSERSYLLFFTHVVFASTGVIDPPKQIISHMDTGL